MQQGQQVMESLLLSSKSSNNLLIRILSNTGRATCKPFDIIAFRVNNPEDNISRPVRAIYFFL